VNCRCRIAHTFDLTFLHLYAVNTYCVSWACITNKELGVWVVGTIYLSAISIEYLTRKVSLCLNVN
jgi:hypothetical protein